MLHSRPCSLAYTCRRAVSTHPVYSVRSARMFASGFLQPALTERISAFRYTSALSTCDWTCALIVPFPHDMLDARFGFGTLAERTSKQPGKPGTQQAKWRVASKAALSFETLAHESRMKQSIHSLLCLIAVAALCPSGKRA